MSIQQNTTTLLFIAKVNAIMKAGHAVSYKEIVDKIQWDKTNFSSVMNGRRQAPLEVYQRLQKVFTDEYSNDNFVGEGTPVYELNASASQMENMSQVPEVPAFRVKIPGYEDCNFGMYVYGHSMYPTIETGSLILCRKVNDKSIIMYGEIYLIRTADYLMVKRLQKNETKGNVLCTSDNFEKRSPDFRRFESFDMPIDKIIDLYLVKGIIKKTQS